MNTMASQHTSTMTKALSLHLHTLITATGLIVALLQPSSLVAETWSVLNSGNASGNWNLPANWNPTTVPNSSSAAVDFSTQDITADSTVTLDMSAQVNSLSFGDADTSSAAGWTVSGTLTNTLAGPTPTITVNSLGLGKVATISVVLAGSAGMIKAGSGTLAMSKAIAYTGGTVINDGTIKLMSNNLLSGNLTVNSLGIFNMNGFFNNSSTPGINVISGSGTIENTGATKNITIGNSGGGGTFSGVIRGTLSITKNGGGNIALTGSSTFDGSIRCQGGKITFNSIGTIGSTDPSALGRPTTEANGYINFGSGGVSGGTFTYTGTGHSTDRIVDLNSASGTCVLEANGTGPLVFTTNFLASALGARTLQLTGTSTATNTLGGRIIDNATVGSTTLTAGFSAGTNLITLSSVDGINTGAPISGTGIAAGTTVAAINTSTRVVTLSQTTTASGGVNNPITVAGVINRTSVTKAGIGSWVLTGNNTYTGPTTVSDGTLIVNGSLTVNSTVSVAANKTLGGSGTINGVTSLATGAVLKPGFNGIGTLTFANTGSTVLTLNKNTLHFDLPNVTGPVDKIAISGGLLLNGTNKIVLAYTGHPRSGTHTIMTYASKTTGSTGTFVFDQEYHPTPTLTIGETSVTVTIPGEGTVLSFK
jgi:autotransporter-associated beta strand protein